MMMIAPLAIVSLEPVIITWIYTVPVLPEAGVAAAVPPLPLPAAELLLFEAEPEPPVVPDAAAEVLAVSPEPAAPEAAGSLVEVPVPVAAGEVVEPVSPEVAVPTAEGEATVPPVSPPVELEPAPEDPVGPDCAAPAVVLVPLPELPPWVCAVLLPLSPEPVWADCDVEELSWGVVRVAAVLVLVSANAVRPVTACTATKISTAAPMAAAILAANLTNRDTIPPHTAGRQPEPVTRINDANGAIALFWSNSSITST